MAWESPPKASMHLHTCHLTQVAVWHLSIILYLTVQLHTSSQAVKLPFLYTLVDRATYNYVKHNYCFINIITLVCILLSCQP